MGKVYRLDTATKGTGASVRPLDERPDGPRAGADEPAWARPRRREPRRAPAPERPARRPPRFKVVDVLTAATLAEDVDTRGAVDALRDVRAVNDVRVFARRGDDEGWRLLTLAEQRALWDARYSQP